MILTYHSLCGSITEMSLEGTICFLCLACGEWLYDKESLHVIPMSLYELRILMDQNLGGDDGGRKIEPHTR